MKHSFVRYASGEMLGIWSDQEKFSTWRTIWCAIAYAQMKLGLPITESQLSQMKENINNIDFDFAQKEERRIRHDVMAHIHTFEKAAPLAKGIIHMGCTSMDIDDNGKLIQIHGSLKILSKKIDVAISRLADFAEKNANLPVLGLTHYQPAQPTTLGKRVMLWLENFIIARKSINLLLQNFSMRGIRGATGTQDSFMKLFDGYIDKVKVLEKMVIEKLGFDFEKAYLITGQTYPRIFDVQVADAVKLIGVAAKKMATDIRLMANRKELEEPFGKNQVGSSAMAYKRNPMRSERICGLSRTLFDFTSGFAEMASEQWMERTLDDSSQCRVQYPNLFFCADAILEACCNVTKGLVVYPAVIEKNLMEELPFMVTESIIMEGCKAGGDREELHESIRVHSQESARMIKELGKTNDLIERLKKDPLFTGIDMNDLMNAEQYTGLACVQVRERLSNSDIIEIRNNFSDENDDVGSAVKV